MRISKTISILFFGSIVFLVSTVIAQSELAARDPVVDRIYLGQAQATKTSEAWPVELDKNVFQADQDSDGRFPAAVKKQAHWSASTSDGFEFKVRTKNQVSAVWVMKRNERYDLIFANNAGSRVNISIPAQQFYALKNAATDLRAPASDLSKCKDQFMQLEVVEEKTRKTISACLMTKGQQAEELRQFGSTLTAFVR